MQVHDNQLELWRSASLLLMQELIENGTEITLTVQINREAFSFDLEIAGILTDLDSNIAMFRASDTSIAHYLHTSDGEMAIPFNISFVLNVICIAGYPLPMLHRGHGHILAVRLQDGELYLTIRLSPHFTTRAIRRHERLDWEPYMKASVGLKIISPIPKKRIFLRPVVDDILRETEHKPEIMNISAGGACLLVHRELASHSMAESSSYLMVFSPYAERNKPPFIIQCRKSGIRPDSEVGLYVGLRLQFVRELDWKLSTEDLFWKNIIAYGSDTFGEVVEKFRNGQL